MKIDLENEVKKRLEVNMHHLPKAMQYRQAHWAIFWVICLTKLSIGKVSQVRSLTPNFTVVALKMWAYRRQNSQIANFWYNFAKKGYTPLTNFCKIWHGEGLPGSYPHTKFLPLWLRKCELTAQKITKNGNFWYKFSPKGYIPLSHFFYKILPGGGSPKTAPACQISPL